MVASDLTSTASFPSASWPGEERSTAILNVKAIAIVGVALHHIVNRRFDSGTLAQIELVKELSSWCVLVFLAASGWLHALSLSRRPVGFGSFLRRRALRLLLPYVALTLLYTAVWQVVQTVAPGVISDRLPAGFWEKVAGAFSPQAYRPVAEQLYFLPLLFLVSILAHGARLWLGKPALFVLGLLLWIGGIALGPGTVNTGFTTAVLCFGGGSYLAGFLLQDCRSPLRRWGAVLSISGATLGILGIAEFSKVVPLLVLAGLPVFAFPRWKWLSKLGEASGTVFAYHTPFLLQPLIIVASGLPVAWQFPAAIGAALASVAICAVGHHLLAGTKLRWALM